MEIQQVDRPIEMATWDVSRAHKYGGARRSICTNLPEGPSMRANWPDSAGMRMEREIQRQSGKTRGQKCGRMVP